MKYTVNLLSFLTLGIIFYAVTAFIDSITTVSQVAEFTPFGKWFLLVVFILMLIGGFTNLQVIYETMLIKDTKEAE